MFSWFKVLSTYTYVKIESISAAELIFQVLIILIAYFQFVCLCLARKTFPNPPQPNFSIISYQPKQLLGSNYQPREAYKAVLFLINWISSSKYYAPQELKSLRLLIFNYFDIYLKLIFFLLRRSQTGFFYGAPLSQKQSQLIKNMLRFFMDQAWRLGCPRLERTFVIMIECRLLYQSNNQITLIQQLKAFCDIRFDKESAKFVNQQIKLLPMITGINPQIQQSSFSISNANQSKGKEKAELRKVQSNAELLKNRINALRNHQQRQLQTIQKNQQKVNDLLKKKLIANQVSQYKYKHIESNVQDVLQKKRKNLQQKINHQSQMSVILKALNMVKKQEANQIRSASMKHLKKIKQMKQEIKQVKKQKHMGIMYRQHQSKVNYLQQIKDKLTQQVQNRKNQILQIRKKKSQQLQRIEKLSQQQNKLLQNISKLHSQSTEQRQRYFAALKVPAKKVADALGIQWTINQPKRKITSASQISKSQISDLEIFRKSSKAYQVHLNQDKLKAAMERIKQQIKKQRSV